MILTIRLAKATGDASGAVCVRRLSAAAAAVLYSSTRNMYFEVCVFWLNFLLRKCCTAVVEMFTYFTNAIKTNSEVAGMFTYLQTLYNTAAAAADSIRTQTACLCVLQPSRATKIKKFDVLRGWCTGRT